MNRSHEYVRKCLTGSLAPAALATVFLVAPAQQAWAQG